MSDFDLEAPRVVLQADHTEPVRIASPQSQEEAEVIRATLDAQGITATLQNASLSAGAGMVAETADSGNWTNGVYVSAADAETAQAILNAESPTEDELSDEAMEGETLEEAEARVKDL